MSLKKLLLRILLLVPIPLWINSCEFETKRIYEREVNKDMQPPDVAVVDLDLDDDTLFLFYSKDFSFRFVSNNQPVESVRILIDGTETQIITSGTGVFVFDHNSLSEGGHTLGLDLVTSSGTNSIADILGAEGFLFSKSWVLYVVKDFNIKHETRVKDGCLNFSWKEYPAGDFREYVIYREKNYFEKIEVGRTTSTEFTDCSYVGEGGKYFVEVLKKDGLFFDWGWGYAELNRELPELSFVYDRDNMSTITWTKSKYYNAIRKTYVGAMRRNDPKYTRIKETENPDDTTCLLPAGYYFGETLNIKIHIEPENNVMYLPDYYPSYDIELTNQTVGYNFLPPFMTCYALKQTSASEFIYTQGCDSLVRYSIESLRPVEKFTYEPSYCSMCKFLNFQVSASGKFLTTFIDCDYDLLMAGTESMGRNKQYNLRDISSPNGFSSVPVSDAGTGIVTHKQSGFYIYDFNNQEIKGYYNNELYGATGLAISSGGNYILLKDDRFRLVSFENSRFTPVWEYPGYDIPKFYCFHAADPDKLIIWDGSVLSVRNCSDFSLILDFPLTDEMLLNVDFYSNEMLSYSGGHLFVRNLSDGSVVDDVPVFFNGGEWYKSCKLINHAIVAAKGIIYFVKQV
jgi:hypothetical protein